jgi:hypothetical protein
MCVLGEPARQTPVLAASSVTLAPSDVAGKDGEAAVAQVAQRGFVVLRVARCSLMAFCVSLRVRSFVQHLSYVCPSLVQKPHLTPGLFWRGGWVVVCRAASPDRERRGLRWVLHSVCST